MLKKIDLNKISYVKLIIDLSDEIGIPIEETKHLVGQDLEEHIATLEKKMLNYATKLEFEDAARIRDEINRLKAKQVGIPTKVLEFKKITCDNRRMKDIR